MKVMKGLKKVGALAGVAVLSGVTAGAAVSAADLSDYPAPFVSANGVFDGKLVIGANAATSDVVGAIDIAASLQAASGTPTSGGSGTVAVANGQVEEIAPGTALSATTEFSPTVDDTDLPGVLQDSSVTISVGGETESYDFHEEIQLTSGISVETGLSYSSNRGEDWEDRVFIPATSGSMKYCVVFDETLQTGTYIANATSTDPIYLDFLGRELEIQGATATSITVKAGQEFNLNAGESVVIDGHTVTMVKTGGTSAVVEVDGQRETLNQGSARTINGLRCEVDNVFDDDGIEFDSADVICGDETVETYDDGEEFIGEDKDDPAWVWDLSGLDGGSPNLCVEWALNIDDDDETENPMYEHPLYEGESYVFPFGYAQVTFDSLKLDDYQKYEIEDTTKDLYDSDSATSAYVTTAKVLRVKAVGADDQGLIATDGEKTDSIYIYPWADSTDTVGIFREETSGSKAIFVANYTTTNNASDDIFQVDYKQSTFNVMLDWDNSTDGGNLSFEMSTTDQLRVYFEGQNPGVTYLGHSDSDTTTALDVVWDNDNDGVGGTDISGWEENTRTTTGVVIEDPDASSSSDRVTIQVPSDIAEFEANVVISGTGASSTSSNVGTGGAVRVNPIAVGLAVLDSDASGLLGRENLIVVGGPCVNTIAATLLDNPESCAEGFSEGYARIQAFDQGSKVAYLVAGYGAADTTAAARVLADYEQYSADLTGSEVEVVTSTQRVTAPRSS